MKKVILIEAVRNDITKLYPMLCRYTGFYAAIRPSRFEEILAPRQNNVFQDGRILDGIFSNLSESVKSATARKTCNRLLCDVITNYYKILGYTASREFLEILCGYERNVNIIISTHVLGNIVDFWNMSISANWIKLGTHFNQSELDELLWVAKNITNTPQQYSHYTIDPFSTQNGLQNYPT